MSPELAVNRFDQDNIKNREIYRDAGLEAREIAGEMGLDDGDRQRVFNRLVVPKQLMHGLKPSREALADVQQPLAVNHPKMKLADARLGLKSLGLADAANDAVPPAEAQSASKNFKSMGQGDSSPDTGGYGSQGKWSGYGAKDEPNNRGSGSGQAAGTLPAAGFVALFEGMGAVGRIAAPVAIVAVIAECGYVYYQRDRGEIDAPEAKKRYVIAGAGGAGGILGAMVAGAVAGSVVPGPGTLVGGIAGGLAAMFGSRVLAKKMMR